MRKKRRKKQNRGGSGSYLQPYVQCPFYKRDNGSHTVVCEGIVDNSSISQTYRFEKQYRKQMEIFCCEHFRNCEVYRMLMEKYN